MSNFPTSTLSSPPAQLNSLFLTSQLHSPSYREKEACAYSSIGILE